MPGFKLINLNTANPYVIGQIVSDYLTIGDYQTLKNIGLTQSHIDDLVNRRVVWAAADPLKATTDTPDLIWSGKINPPTDMDIPGDLLKIYWVYPGQKDYWGGNILFSPSRYVPEQYTSPVFASFQSQRPSYNISGENSHLARNYINPDLLDFETAPTLNRLWTLANAYGSHLSYIFCTAAGMFDPGYGTSSWLKMNGRPVDGINMWLAGSEVPSTPPEIISSFVFGDIPFDGEGRDQYNIYWQTLVYSIIEGGIFDGTKYNERRQIYQQGRHPFGRGDLNPATGTNYGVDEIVDDFALDGKFQVPGFLNYFKSRAPNDPNRLQVYLDQFRTYWGGRNVGLGATSPSPLIDGQLYMPGIRENPSIEQDILLELPDGTVISTPGYYGYAWVPWIEWPQIYSESDQIHRPSRSPLGKVTTTGEWDEWLEFAREAGEHYIAMREWFDAGCPCDWQDWDGFTDPQTQALEAEQESTSISIASGYIPAVFSSSLPPSNPKQGDLWRDAVTGTTKIFTITDGTTGIWMDQ